jgi:murein DD-endopeptidase MepM/ murein hydrolase activator NlpD
MMDRHSRWLALLLAFNIHASVENGAPFSIDLSSKQVQNGQVSLICLQAKTWPDALSAQAGAQHITLIENPKSNARCGFIPVPLEQEEGEIEVVLIWEQNGSKQSKKIALIVKQGTYIENKLKVDPDLTSPSPENLKRIEREQKELNAVYAALTKTPLWKDSFQPPINTKVTSRFGNRRTFNGEVKSRHQGVDLRAKTGVPIFAANTGVVVFAKELFLAGNTVIIDHGAGITSSYAHLNSIDVKVGQTVKRGEKLGAAGATGRVTGPHLHWGMRVNGVLVDPHQMRTVFNEWWAS